MSETGNKICPRCKKHETQDVICNSCKNELLSNYEVSSDWQTAYEIEKAQMIASRFKHESDDDPLFSNNMYY
jgi:hypothetical protein